MTILDLIECVDEYHEVIIIDSESGNPIACYDGRNSIPNRLNSCVVKKESSEAYRKLRIEI